MGAGLRSALRDRVVDSVTAHRSVVLAGEMGVGKTHLLGDVISELRSAGWICTQLWANPAAATIPFGALAAFAEGGEGIDRLEMLRSTVAALSAVGGDRPHAIAIDDAPLLDEQSIAVLHQLCATKSVVLLATARSTDPETPALEALWRSVDAERLIVEPLDDNSAALLASAALDAEPDAPAVTQIVHRSAGNPLFIGELARAASHGSPDGLTPRLRDVVGARIARLDDTTRHQLLLITVADPLDVDLDIVDLAAVERLEGAGLVTTAEDDDYLLARPAHPLYGEVVRDQLTALQRKAVARELTMAMQSRPTVRRGDALRLAGWLRACGDEPSAELAVPAALEAIALLDAELANELVSIATSVEPDYAALFAAGEIARLTGDVERALAWFERAFAVAREAAEIRPVALAIGQLHGFFRNAPDEAVRVLSEAADRLDDPVQRLELETERAMFGSMLGRYEDVLVAASKILEHPDCDLEARWTACTNVSWAEAQLVDLRNIHTHLDTALGLVEQMPPERAGELDLVSAVQVNAFMEEGRLDDAVASAAAAVASGGVLFDSPAGLTTFSVSQVSWMRGDRVEARRQLTGAIEHLAAFDAFNAYPFVRAAASILSSIDGNPAAAVAEIDASLDRGGDTGMWDQIWLGRARAWLQLAAGDVASALDALITAGDVGIDTTHRGWAVLTLHDAIAWGHASAVEERLGELRSQMHDAPLFELLAENAATVTSASATDVEREIARLRAMGSTWHAGVVSAGLALRCIEAGDDVVAARHASAARLWMGITCPQAGAVMDAALSTRRLSIVEAALSGDTSREISERLFLSTRTVDNHLGAVYSALDVGGRADLVELFAP